MPAADLKVAHAKEMLKRIGGRGCVVLVFDDDGRYAVAEWGKDKRECGKLKVLVDAIADGLVTGKLPAP